MVRIDVKQAFQIAPVYVAVGADASERPPTNRQTLSAMLDTPPRLRKYPALPCGARPMDLAGWFRSLGLDNTRRIFETIRSMQSYCRG